MLHLHLLQFFMLSTTVATTEIGLIENQSFNVFEIVLVGFLFVFCILLILSLATWAFGKVFARMSVEAFPGPMAAGATPKPSTVGRPSANGTEASDFDVSDPRHVAVVAAAIHCVMQGRKHRIVSIHSSDSAWAAEGRRQIFSSRNVR